MDRNAVVYLVDDDQAVRDSLKWVIESAGFTVETYASSQAFLDAYRHDRPGCLVLDVRMPGISGLNLQTRLADKHSILPIIFISAHATVPDAVRAMRAGAVDFLIKPFNNQDLLDRIEQCVAEAVRRREERRQREEVARRLATLTPREREVLDGVVAGRTNRAIAAEMKVSVKTVDAHRAKVMDKMQASSLAELVHLMHLPPPP
ncbi:LuxR family transcriptional regulator [Sulfurifustis variabilis]|uniref:LuxR family transcriptional regulator n=1 Tax=Sulfurifustis variabilis TaxID=1675686 RepID=A0A1B4V672_9GAMM|nr:response regulator transcription factor [Sulfurifustis variabilis]BAU49008.1 LuxR family transcriptional regulator [Sulfurifustis variabilis]